MTTDAALLEGIRFRWRPGGPVALDIPALAVAKGEHLFIKGPSGSGKTTLLNLLGGVAVPEAGSIRLLGTDIVGLGAAARDRFRADHIGFIFQMFNLIPYLSAADNVALPCRFSRARRARAEAKAGGVMAEVARLLDRLGLRGVAASPAQRLSVGQQQRIAAARALIGAPELVIADEPTSALDEDVRRVFLDLLFREADEAGSTVLFVSHDGTLQEMFSRVVALNDLNRAGAGGGVA